MVFRGLNELGRWIWQLIQAYHQYGVGSCPALQKGSTRLAIASDKVYQLLAQGRWFSPGTPASSTTKTGRHDKAEILLKVALNTKIFKFYGISYKHCMVIFFWKKYLFSSFLEIQTLDRVKDLLNYVWPWL